MHEKHNHGTSNSIDGCDVEVIVVTVQIVEIVVALNSFVVVEGGGGLAGYVT